MSRNGDKPGKEKRKPKKEKLTGAKTNRGDTVLEHVAQHGGQSQS